MTNNGIKCFEIRYNSKIVELKIKSISLNGLEGYIINVQVDVSAGMPSWDIVGLPDTSIKESKERVRTAIKNSGYELLSRKVVQSV